MILYSANEYQTFLRQQLGRVSPHVVAELQTIFATYAGERALALEVDIHSDQLDGPLPVRVSLLCGTNETESWDLAKQVPQVLDQEQMAELARFDQAGVEISAVTLQTLIEWFANCWDLASGPESGFACQISIHGDIEAFDLNQHQWIQKEIPPKTRQYQSPAFL